VSKPPIVTIYTLVPKLPLIILATFANCGPSLLSK